MSEGANVRIEPGSLPNLRARCETIRSFSLDLETRITYSDQTLRGIAATHCSCCSAHPSFHSFHSSILRRNDPPAEMSEAEVLLTAPGPSRQSPWGEAEELRGLTSAASVSARDGDRKGEEGFGDP